MGNECKKPPLGLIPRGIWEGKRLEELYRAIGEYTVCGLKVPAEWLEEARELSSRLKRLEEEDAARQINEYNEYMETMKNSSNMSGETSTTAHGYTGGGIPGDYVDYDTFF